MAALRGCRLRVCKRIDGRQGLGKREGATGSRSEEMGLRAIAARFSYRRRETQGHGVQSSWAEGERYDVVQSVCVCCSKRRGEAGG